MSILNRIEALARFRANGLHGPAAPWWMGIMAAVIGALAAGAGCFAAACVLLPPHLIFPVTAAGLLIAAAWLGLMAGLAPPETGAARLVVWDFAGALGLIGLAAALFGEPEQAIALLERDR
jgi:hypothetical protein